MERKMDSPERQNQKSTAERSVKSDDNAMYAISRVHADRHGQNAWLVNLSRGGKTFQMTFSDGTLVGTRKL